MPTTPQRKLSLTQELLEIRDALSAVRLISSALDADQLGVEDDFRRAPRYITAILSLAVARIRVVTRVLRGEVDPTHILESFNDASDVTDDDDEDVLLVEWSASRVLQHARQLLERAKVRLNDEDLD